MLLDHSLDPILGIASRADEVLLGIVHLILAQLLSGLGQLQLVVQRILLGSDALASAAVTLGDLRLLGRQIVLGFL